MACKSLTRSRALTCDRPLRAIASGATRNNEIATRARVDTPALGRLLARLVELGYVEHREPVEASGGAKRAIYRLRDPYFRFWFRYVFPNRSRLTRGRVEEVLDEIEADLDNHMGLVFEDCCRDWVGRYAGPDQLPPVERIGSWWSRNVNGQVEIDVVGLDGRRHALLGSCKWNKRASTHVLGQLLEQREMLGASAASAALAIFARGFDKELVRRAAQEDVRLFSAEDLFAQTPHR